MIRQDGKTSSILKSRYCSSLIGPVAVFTEQSLSRPQSSTRLRVKSLLLQCGSSWAALVLTSSLTQTADEFLSCTLFFCSVLLTD